MTKQIRNLSKQKIVDMAIIILENDGFENLSMRNLATKLGVKAAALYNHIKNKTMLVKELQLHFLNPNNRLYNPDYNVTTWQEFMTSRIEAKYNELMARPYTLELFSKNICNLKEKYSDDLLEKYLSKMLSFGFSVADAIYINNFTGIYMNGHCSFVLGIKRQLEEDPNILNFTPVSDSLIPFATEISSKGVFDFDRAYNFALKHLIEGISSLQNKNKLKPKLKN